jgi:LPXTG-motif cell wall-anchored protein
VVGYAAAFEFTDPTATWSPLGPLLVGDQPFEQRGSVSLSADGSRLAVGSRLRAQVFEWDSAALVWVQLGEDLGSDIVEGGLGHVHLSGAGDRLAVAVFRSDGDGAVRVYDWDEAAGAWLQSAPDLAPTGDGAGFASSFALSGSGTRLVVGAPGAPLPPVGEEWSDEDPGHVHVFDWDPIARRWMQIGAVISGDAPRSRFGEGVAVSSDGNRFAVTALATPGVISSSSEVRVYEISTTQPTGPPATVGDRLPATGTSTTWPAFVIGFALIGCGVLFVGPSRRRFRE